MSFETAQVTGIPGTSDGVAAAEDAVRALWSALNRLDHSLTYLLPENCEDALNGESCRVIVGRSGVFICERQVWKACARI